MTEVNMDLRLNSDLWEAEPLNDYERKRLGRVLHQRSREINVMRIGDGSRVRVNGATFEFGSFMATLRQLIADPDSSTGDKAAAIERVVAAAVRLRQRITSGHGDNVEQLMALYHAVDDLTASK